MHKLSRREALCGTGVAALTVGAAVIPLRAQAQSDDQVDGPQWREALANVEAIVTAHKAQINKTDRNDARGIAQMIRAGLYRPVHVKTLLSQKLRMLLTHRKLLQSKAIAIENDLRTTLRNFGLKVGVVGTVKFEARIKELVENLPDLVVLVEPLLMSDRCCASSSASCIAACWPSCGTMMCAGA